MATYKKHLAELLLETRLHGPADRLRSRIGFSPDMEAVQSILFNPKFNRQAKIAAYREWLETNQPCVFGRIASKNKNVFICLFEDSEILRMQKGDEDVIDTIQDHRQVWKRHALEGRTSSFVIALISPRLVYCEPDAGLKEIPTRLVGKVGLNTVPQHFWSRENPVIQYLSNPHRSSQSFHLITTKAIFIQTI